MAPTPGLTFFAGTWTSTFLCSTRMKRLRFPIRHTQYTRNTHMSLLQALREDTDSKKATCPFLRRVLDLKRCLGPSRALR